MGRRQQGPAHQAEVRPVDVDGVRTVAIVTVGWGVAFVIMALRQGALNDAGRGWWLWTCLAGVGLGLLGLEYCRKRRDAYAQAALDAEANADDASDPSLVGDWSRMPEDSGYELGSEPSELPVRPAQPDDYPAPPPGTHVTQPYAPGYSTGDLPQVPSQAEPMPAPMTQPRATSREQTSPAHARPPWPDAAAPVAPARPRPQAPAQRPAASAERPAASGEPPAVQPPAQQPSVRPRSAPPPPPPARPEPPPPDPYSTGAGWYDSPAGYSPDPDRARRHPRDRAPDSPRQSDTGTASQPNTGRPRRRSLEDSEFFGEDSRTPPPNSTAEFLLADLADEDEQQPPPARHDRDEPDEYRDRRANRPR